MTVGVVTWKSTFLIPLLAHVIMNATAVEGTTWMSLIVSGIVLVDGVWLINCNDREDELVQG